MQKSCEHKILPPSTRAPLQSTVVLVPWGPVISRCLATDLPLHFVVLDAWFHSNTEEYWFMRCCSISVLLPQKKFRVFFRLWMSNVLKCLHIFVGIPVFYETHYIIVPRVTAQQTEMKWRVKGRNRYDTILYCPRREICREHRCTWTPPTAVKQPPCTYRQYEPTPAVQAPNQAKPSIWTMETWATAWISTVSRSPLCFESLYVRPWTFRSVPRLAARGADEVLMFSAGDSIKVLPLKQKGGEKNPVIL